MNFTVKNLSVVDKDYEILHDLSFSINDKRFIGIIGANGSGKSTLLNAIARSIPCKTGQVFFDQKDLFDLPFNKSAQIMSSLSQEHEIPFDFHVRELVMMGRYPFKKMFQVENEKDNRIVDGALKQVGIANLQDKNYQHLSGGEKQRTLIARMIAQTSKILLLDEPTNHLDISYQLDLFNFLKASDCMVISAIHDLNMAASYCDYLIVLKNQKIVYQDIPEKILCPEIIKDVFSIDVEIIHTKKRKLVIVF